MNIEEIKESVEEVRRAREYGISCGKDARWNYNNSIDVLIDLAEQYLAVAGKMPEKMSTNNLNCYCDGNGKNVDGHCCCEFSIVETHNSCVDDCTLATVGMFLSEK